MKGIVPEERGSGAWVAEKTGKRSRKSRFLVKLTKRFKNDSFLVFHDISYVSLE
jgi:hypothetical protein